MKNIKPFLKRLVAYTIDLFIVMIIASLISSIPIFNKNIDKYQKTYKEYEEEYTKHTDYINLLEESYKDKEITEEEYTKLIEKEQYKKIISSKYDDQTISKKEYTEIVTTINEEFESISTDYVYKLSKQSVSNSIITLICTLVYFGIFQYILKGQTIGKKIFKLKIVSSSDKKLNIINYLLRSLIINDVLLNAIGVILILLVSKTIYITANNIISIIISIVEAIIVYLVITREDQRGLHDLLFNTKVISTEPVETENKPETKKIIEAKKEEEKGEISKNDKEKSKTSRRKK